MIKKNTFKNEIINITENAWNKIVNINKKVIVNNGFLFSAKTGGCNGFNSRYEKFLQTIQRNKTLVTK